MRTKKLIIANQKNFVLISHAILTDGQSKMFLAITNGLFYIRFTPKQICYILEEILNLKFTFSSGRSSRLSYSGTFTISKEDFFFIKCKLIENIHQIDISNIDI